MADEEMLDDWFLEWQQAGKQFRLPIRGQLTIGRSRGCDVTIEDPYISRVHCTVELRDGHPFVDASEALNGLRIGAREASSLEVKLPRQVFSIANNSFAIVNAAEAESDRTLTYTLERSLILRASTRELTDSTGKLLAQFSTAEYLAFSTLARRFPDAANHSELGEAVWGGMGYDQYQLHRLLQRIRQRLGDLAVLLENVRGEGYRFQARVDIR
jgi:hypothetical protein